MRALFDFVRLTLLGGLAFLLPFGIVAVILQKLYGYAKPIGNTVHAQLGPRADHFLIPVLIAVLILGLTSFLAGLFARSTLGRKTFSFLESRILEPLPPYTILRDTFSAITGGQAQLANAGETKVVKVQFDDMAMIGFFMCTSDDGDVIVYLPGAPSAFSGTIVSVKPGQVSEINLSTADLLIQMRRFGAGLEKLEKKPL